MNGGALHGMIAEFEQPEPLLDAARRAREAGYTRLNAYTPFPVEGLAEALGLRATKVPLATLVGAAVGAGGAFWMQTYSAVFSYPHNIGGRPLFSWPSFVPLTFELGVLGAALFGTAAMLIGNRLPRLHHPIFNAPGFRRATRDRFFLFIDAGDERFDAEAVGAFLESLGPRRVRQVRA